MDGQYQAIQTKRLYEKIVEQIERRILSGELKVGDRMLPERELADQFQVSRTAVREAVKALSEKGLVEVRPGRGTFVTNGTSKAFRFSFGMSMIGQDGGTRDLVELREIFEPEIAALAALRATQEHLDTLQEAVATMDLSLNDANTYIEADMDFHLALAEASQNALISTLIDSIVDLLREQRTAIFNVEGGPQRGQVHHKRILEAVQQRNPQAARETMRIHLQQVREDSQASGKV